MPCTPLSYGRSSATVHVYRNKRTGNVRYQAWYCLELKQVVKLRENLETGTRIRELIAFKLR